MWDTASDILIWVLAGLLILLNLASVALVIFQLPGSWVMLALTGLFALGQTWFVGWDADAVMISVWTILAMLALAIIGEIVEMLAGAQGAKKAGGTKTAAVLAIVGGVVGALLGTVLIPVPIVGTILGACIGAGAAALTGDLLRGRNIEQASLTARGAAVGKLWGTLAKMVIVTMMWLLATAAIFWP